MLIVSLADSLTRPASRYDIASQHILIFVHSFARHSRFDDLVKGTINTIKTFHARRLMMGNHDILRAKRGDRGARDSHNKRLYLGSNDD